MAIARPYRSLILWFGLQILLGAANQAVRQTPVLALPVSLGLLGTLVALAVYAYRVSRALGSQVAVLWALAMGVPCLNFITLIVLSSRATAACQQAGIPVGLLGPKV